MLAWTIYLSFAAAAGMFLVPAVRPQVARWLALLGALGPLALALAGAVDLAAGGELVTVARVPWIPSLGAEYHLAADGISRVLLLLTGLAAVAGVLFSWNVAHRPREFFALYLVLIGAVYGVFLSFDLLLFFVFYEIAIIPKYFLIAIWGSANREYAAMKLALYSFVGSAAVLVGVIALYVAAGAQTFDLNVLARHTFAEPLQAWAFPVIFTGFAVLAGLWPFHTWAPTGHAAAPTAASMLLAGVVMKLGAYGCLRVAMAVLPAGLMHWQGVFATLATIGIVWGALVALRQRDFKLLIGYSSVSHMGFVLLGLASVTLLGLAGAVLQMFSHGVIAGLLFGVAGRMIYDREHTRDLDALEARRLGWLLPFAGVTFVLAGLASMGLPGFSGFVAELKVLLGTWPRFPVLVLVAGVGIVLGVGYTLRAVQTVFYSGELGALPATEATSPAPEPISLPEKAGAVLLLTATIVVGLFPRLLLDWIEPALRGPFFEALRKGAGL